MPPRQAPLLALSALVFALAGCQAGASTASPREPPNPTVVPGLGSVADPQPAERIVGDGFAVIHEARGGPMPEASSAEQAVVQLVLAEIRAGRAKEIPRRGPLPPMHVVEATFSAALLDVINPWQARSYEEATPRPAWVIVFAGSAPDGEYSALGVVDDATGRPLVVQVWLPGA